MEDRVKIIHPVLLVIAFSFLVGGYMLENPFVPRGPILLVLSFVFLAGFAGLYWLKRNESFVMGCVALMTLALVLIEYYSKYAVNYLYHVVYFVVIVAVVLYLGRVKGIVLGLLVSIASFIKFIQLIAVEPTQNNWMTFMFFGIIQLLLMVMLSVTKAYNVEANKTKSLYAQLLDAYSQLNSYSKQIEVLSAKEERSSIARDLHDTLGHELTGLIMQLELAKYNIEQGESAGMDYLNDSIEAARNSLTGVRAIVDTLKNREKLVFTNQSLKDLVDEFSKRTNMDIDLSIENEKGINPDYLVILYWVLQEGLTNVAKHSASTYTKVVIGENEESITFCICDYPSTKAYRLTKGRGRGKKVEVTEGNGLTGIRERLAPVNGQVIYTKYSGEYKGFEIKGKIPKLP